MGFRKIVQKSPGRWRCSETQSKRQRSGRAALRVPARLCESLRFDQACSNLVGDADALRREADYCSVLLETYGVELMFRHSSWITAAVRPSVGLRQCCSLSPPGFQTGSRGRYSRSQDPLEMPRTRAHATGAPAYRLWPRRDLSLMIAILEERARDRTGMRLRHEKCRWAAVTCANQSVAGGADAQQRLHDGFGNPCAADRGSRKGSHPRSARRMSGAPLETLTVGGSREMQGHGLGLVLVDFPGHGMVAWWHGVDPGLATAAQAAAAVHAQRRLTNWWPRGVRGLPTVRQEDREKGNGSSGTGHRSWERGGGGQVALEHWG